MKKLIGLVLLMLILTAAMSPRTDSNKPLKKGSIEGTWELQSHYIYDDNLITDTILANENLRQVKMFYNGKVMWVKYVPQDSTEWFGYGSYETTEDRLRETLEFGSSAIMKIVDTLMVFELELILGDTSYSQINIDDEGNRLFSENYKRLD